MSLKINNDTANGSSTLQPSNTATGDVTHTLPAFTTELAPRMQLMTAQNSTSGTSIDFTGIPSWAKKITVMFNGVSTNGASIVQIHLGTSSGFVMTGYLGCVNESTIYVNMTTGVLLGIDSQTAATRHGISAFNLIGNNSWIFTSVIGHSESTRLPRAGGSVTLSGTLDRLRVTTVNGTDLFDAGLINILVEG